MPAESLELSTVLPASPRRVYEAWLDGEAHGAFTGSPATAEPGIGGAFTAWDGYIQGTNLELEPYHRIVQSWRTTEFPPGSPDSRLEVLLAEQEGGARLTLRHNNIPDGQAQSYEQGWIDFYFAPMQQYFANQSSPR